MNDHDKNNLMFLLNADKQTYDDWLIHASYDDLEYAIELLTYHRAEMTVKDIEAQDDVEDLTQAKQLLDIIRSK